LTAARHKILMVGLGEVARTHLRALEQTPGADVVAAVDTAAKPAMIFREHPVPVYHAPEDAAARHDPDVVVIATPTPTHAAVCGQIAARFPAARVLVEKPAADNLPGALHVLRDMASRQPVDVAYHMAFSPEVSWGTQTVRANGSELGVPVAVEACFADPYENDFEAASQRLSTSWIDSGINALSVLARFVQPVARESLRRIGPAAHSVFEARLTCRAGDGDLAALILTSWHVTDAAKTTRIRYSSGSELVMDHTAVAGYLVHDGRIAAVFGSDRSIPRRERHYLALYQWWLTEGKAIMPAEAGVQLHELLLRPPGGSGLVLDGEP
jgi:predicted dehydrogenase